MTDDLIKKTDSLPDQADKNKIDTAFLQVPAEFKDQVQAYVKELIETSQSTIGISDESIQALSSQGCFLVISLDKIEEIINELKSCLTMEPDNGARNIKTGIQRTLKLLS